MTGSLRMMRFYFYGGLAGFVRTRVQVRRSRQDPRRPSMPTIDSIAASVHSRTCIQSVRENIAAGLLAVKYGERKGGQIYSPKIKETRIKEAGHWLTRIVGAIDIKGDWSFVWIFFQGMVHTAG